MSIDLPDALKSKNFISPELHFNTQETESEESSSAVSSLNESVLNYILEGNSYKSSHVLLNKSHHNTSKILQHTINESTKQMQAPLTKFFNNPVNQNGQIIVSNSTNANQLLEYTTNTNSASTTARLDPAMILSTRSNIIHYKTGLLEPNQEQDQLKEFDGNFPKTPVFNQLYEKSSTTTNEVPNQGISTGNNPNAMQYFNFCNYPQQQQPENPSHYISGASGPFIEKGIDEEEKKGEYFSGGGAGESLRIHHSGSSKTVSNLSYIMPMQNKGNYNSSKYIGYWNQSQSNDVSLSSIFPGPGITTTASTKGLIEKKDSSPLNRIDTKLINDTMTVQSLDVSQDCTPKNPEDNLKLSGFGSISNEAKSQVYPSIDVADIKKMKDEHYENLRKNLIMDHEKNKSSAMKNFQRNPNISPNIQQIGDNLPPDDEYSLRYSVMDNKIKHPSIQDLPPAPTTTTTTTTNTYGNSIPYKNYDFLNHNNNNPLANKAETVVPGIYLHTIPKVIQTVSDIQPLLQGQSSDNKHMFEILSQSFVNINPSSNLESLSQFNYQKAELDNMNNSNNINNRPSIEADLRGEKRTSLSNSAFLSNSRTDKGSLYHSTGYNIENLSEQKTDKSWDNFGDDLKYREHSKGEVKVDSNIHKINDNHQPSFTMLTRDYEKNLNYINKTGSLSSDQTPEHKSHNNSHHLKQDYSHNINHQNSNNLTLDFHERNPRIKSDNSLPRFDKEPNVNIAQAPIAQKKRNDLNATSVDHKPRTLVRDSSTSDIETSKLVSQNPKLLAREKDKSIHNQAVRTFETPSRPLPDTSGSINHGKENGTTTASNETKKNHNKGNNFSMKSSASIEGNHLSNTKDLLYSSKNGEKLKDKLSKTNASCDELTNNSSIIIKTSGKINGTNKDSQNGQSSKSKDSSQNSNQITSEIQVKDFDCGIDESSQNEISMKEKTHTANNKEGKIELKTADIHKREADKASPIETPCGNTCKTEDIAKIRQVKGLELNINDEKTKGKFFSDLNNISSPTNQQQQKSTSISSLSGEKLKDNFKNQLQPNAESKIIVTDDEIELSHSLKSSSSKSPISRPDKSSYQGEASQNSPTKGANILPSEFTLQDQESIMNNEQVINKNDTRISKLDDLEAAKRYEQRKSDILGDIKMTSKNKIKNINSKIPKGIHLFNSPLAKDDRLGVMSPASNRNSATVIQNESNQIQKMTSPKQIPENQNEPSNSTSEFSESAKLASESNSVNNTAEIGSKNKESLSLLPIMEKILDSKMAESAELSPILAVELSSINFSGRNEDKTIIDSNISIPTEILDESYNIETFAETIKNKKQKIFRQIEKIDKQLVEQGHLEIKEQQPQIKENEVEQPIDYLCLPSPSGLRKNVKRNDKNEKQANPIDKNVEVVHLLPQTGIRNTPKSDNNKVNDKAKLFQLEKKEQAEKKEQIERKDQGEKKENAEAKKPIVEHIKIAQLDRKETLEVKKPIIEQIKISQLEKKDQVEKRDHSGKRDQVIEAKKPLAEQIKITQLEKKEQVEAKKFLVEQSSLPVVKDNTQQVNNPSGAPISIGQLDTNVMTKFPIDNKAEESSTKNSNTGDQSKSKVGARKFDTEEFNKVLFGMKDPSKLVEKKQGIKSQIKPENNNAVSGVIGNGGANAGGSGTSADGGNNSNSKLQKDISNPKLTSVEGNTGTTSGVKTSTNILKSPSKDKPILNLKDVSSPRNQDKSAQDNLFGTKIILTPAAAPNKDNFPKLTPKQGNASGMTSQTKLQSVKSAENLRNSVLSTNTQENLGETQSNTREKHHYRKQSMENKSILNLLDKPVERVLTPKPRRKQEKFDEVIYDNQDFRRSDTLVKTNDTGIKLKTSRSQDRIYPPTMYTKQTENIKTDFSGAMTQSTSDKFDWLSDSNNNNTNNTNKKSKFDTNKAYPIDEPRKSANAAFSKSDFFAKSLEWQQRKLKFFEEKEKEIQEKEMKNCTFKPQINSESSLSSSSLSSKLIKPKEFYERNLKWSEQVKNDIQAKQKEAQKTIMAMANKPKNTQNTIIPDSIKKSTALKEVLQFESKSYPNNAKRTLNMASSEHNIFSPNIKDHIDSDQISETFHNSSSNVNTTATNKKSENRKSSTSRMTDSSTNTKKDSLYIDSEKDLAMPEKSKKQQGEDLTAFLTKYQLNSPNSRKSSKINNEMNLFSTITNEHIEASSKAKPKTNMMNSGLTNEKKAITETHTDIPTIGSIKPRDIQTLLAASEKVSKKFQKQFGVQP